jgi:hypothetical protein
MSYTLYEVWAEHLDGHQALIETTASPTEASKLAEQAVLDGYYAGIVLKETEEGDLIEVERLSLIHI